MNANVDVGTSAEASYIPAIKLPYCLVRVEVASAADHASMRARQLASILRNMPLADYSEPLLSLACSLAEKTDQALEKGEIGYGLTLATQLESLLIAIQDDNRGPCDILWMAQQFAKEIRCTLAFLNSTDADAVSVSGGAA